MQSTPRPASTYRRLSARALLTCIVAVTAFKPARADLIVRVESVLVNAGSTVNSFDVSLENDGPDALSIDGFSFGLSVGAEINLTGATISSLTPYLFEGHSLFGPGIATQIGTMLIASDFYDELLGSRSLAPGEVAGLGRVFFDVSPAAVGSYAVTMLPSPETSLAFQGADIPIATLRSGAIAVTAVPEPHAVVLCSLGIATCRLGWRRTLRRESRRC